MSLVDCGPILLGDPNRNQAFFAVSPNAGYQINGSGHRYAWVFPVPRSGTITKAGIRISTCASAVTSRLGLYTVDTNGDPTSTSYGSSAYGTFTPAADTYSEVTLGTAATATCGNIAALVVEFDSTAGDMFVSAGNQTWLEGILPYPSKYNGSSWTKQTSGTMLLGHLYYSDSGGLWPDVGLAPFADTQTVGTFNNASTPDERGIRITLPFKCRIAGIWHGFSYGTSADFDAVLYSDTTELKAVSVDAAHCSTTGTSYTRKHWFGSGHTVSAGDTVIAAIRPTTTNNVSYRQYTTFGAGSEQSLGLPQGSCLATRTDAGSWSYTTTIVPTMGLIIDQLDDGASAGSIAVALNCPQIRTPFRASGY